MGITSWNRCFLCSGSIPKGREAQIKKSSTSTSTASLWQNAGHKPLFQYLLKDLKESSPLYKDILTLTFPDPTEDIESTSTVQFCKPCKEISRSIRDLHLQLEVIQMKIIDTVKNVKQQVINNSKLYGTNAKVKEDLEEFEKYLDSQEKQKSVLGLALALEKVARKRKLLELLDNFQTKVYEKHNSENKYPLVYLERFTGSSVIQDQGKTIHTIVPPRSNKVSLIKEEPPDFETEQEATDPLSAIPDDLMESESDDSSLGDNGDTHIDDDPDWGDSDAESLSGKGRDEKIDIPEPTEPKPSTSTSSLPKGRKRKTQQEDKEESSDSKRNRRLNSRNSKKIASYKEKVEEPPPESLTEAQKIAAEMRRERKRIAEEKRLESRRNFAKLRRSKIPIEKKQGPKRKQYWCKECSFHSNKAPQLDQHLQGHETTEKTFKCPDCNKEFSQKQYFDFHIYVYCGATKWKCDICQESLHGGKLKEHYENFHDGKAFPCENCGYCFGNVQDYLRHTADNHLHSELNFHCTLCPLTDSVIKGVTVEIMRHLYEVHNQTEFALKCDYPDCGKVFYQLTSLSIHKQVHDRTPYRCSFCSKAYAWNNDLQAHILCVHKKRGPQKCDICDEPLLSRPSLISHKRRVHGVGMLKCELCPDKEYNSTVGLWKHKRVAHGIGVNETFTCEHCGKEFISKLTFNRHMTTHTDERNFTCETCGFATKNMQMLKSHIINKHTGVRNQVCAECGKKFLLPCHLRVHMRSHTKEKPYQCEVCGLRVTQLATLDRHRMKKHNLFKRYDPEAASYAANVSSSNNAKESSQPAASASASHSISNVSSTPSGFSEDLKFDVYPNF
ncbi:unnamed protein product [Orchesella dallaii]|uniref:C2H2-type domain-containing protein n=1 Tax=Orchesella dallaii TaxID=48710 RepID=A0ABP1PYG7_9HEXA